MSERAITYGEPVRLSINHNFPGYVDEITRIFRSEGHEIYLVGGSVRDLMLGRECEDHDFAVSADAGEMVRICRKYGLDYDDQYSFIDYVIVHYGDDKIDLNKFKGESIREDLLSRDITINSLAYDAANKEIIDYAGGIEDLRSGVIRLTDPEYLRNQPQVMLRVLRFSIEFGFCIDDESYRCMQDNVDSLESIRMPALIKGMDKLLKHSHDFFVDGIICRNEIV